MLEEEINAVKMKLPLLILGLSLFCTFWAQTTATEELDISKLSGRWYPFLLASTYRGWEQKDFGASIYEIKVTVDDLTITFSVREREECIKIKMIAFRVETNRYQFKYPGRHKFHVEVADPEDFLLISTINMFDTKISEVELYSWRKDGTLNEIAKNKFEEICQLHGFTIGSSIDLTTTDRCFLNESIEISVNLQPVTSNFGVMP
ncbi:major urinary protein-like [Phascolarctos cinereus]